MQQDSKEWLYRDKHAHFFVAFVLFIPFISFIFALETIAKTVKETMKTTKELKKPTKTERRVALASYEALSSTLSQLNSDIVDVEITGRKDKIELPLSALKFLEEILKKMSQGNIISIVPLATEVTTQKAAEILGCSRPHLVKMLQAGEIPFTMVGRHRRIMIEDVMRYKKKKKEQQKQYLKEIMSADEEDGLYDT